MSKVSYTAVEITLISGPVHPPFRCQSETVTTTEQIFAMTSRYLEGDDEEVWSSLR